MGQNWSSTTQSNLNDPGTGDFEVSHVSVTLRDENGNNLCGKLFYPTALKPQRKSYPTYNIWRPRPEYFLDFAKLGERMVLFNPRTMLVLEEVQPPTEDIVAIQSQVVAYWENDCLGQGTIYLTLRTVVWIDNSSHKGFRLTYPAITVHATSSSNETFPEPCLFLVIDVKKTDIEYSQDVEPDMEADDESLTATIRFVPADPSAISVLYEKMNDCQAQNPEMDDQMNESDDEDEEDEPLGEDIMNNLEEGIEGFGDGEWYTADTATGEIRLSAEGRANLERMIGSLTDAADEDLRQPPPKSNGSQMEED